MVTNGKILITQESNRRASGGRSQMVSFRLSNNAYAKILVALDSPRNGDMSVSGYCKKVIERYAFRHDKK